MYDVLADQFFKESEKYWDEAVAEKKRLLDYKPITVDELVLTTKEIERVKSDVAFILDAQTTKEDIRKRLQYYHNLDIMKLS